MLQIPSPEEVVQRSKDRASAATAAFNRGQAVRQQVLHPLSHTPGVIPQQYLPTYALPNPLTPEEFATAFAPPPNPAPVLALTQALDRLTETLQSIQKD